MRILEGVGTLIQLAGLVARLCKMVRSFSFIVRIPVLTRGILGYEARVVPAIAIICTIYLVYLYRP